MKITLFYAHTASNIGDIAINNGTSNLLRTIYPDSILEVVFIDAEQSQYLEMSKSSLDDKGHIRFSLFKTNGKNAARYLYSPKKFFEAAGGLDSDVVLLASGEHLFAYQEEENTKVFLCPSIRCKFLGKKCIQLLCTDRLLLHLRCFIE